MLAILSPAKRLNLKETTPVGTSSQALFLKKSQSIIDEMKKMSPRELMNLMKISENLANLNYERYQQWNMPFTNANSKPAIHTFMGDAYRGLGASSFSSENLTYAQGNLRILSGLHGILRPLDLIQAYRLEFGISLSVSKKKDLYDYWSEDVTHHLNETLKKHYSPILINLASKEYFSAIDMEKFEHPILNVNFKEFKDGQYKFYSMYGKYARGLMTRFMIKNRIQDVEELKLFDYEGYMFNVELSSENNWVFTREFPKKS